MTERLVSVVIPFLDPPGEFLREAVESVLAQTYRPLELLLVNDGSDARTRMLATRLVAASSISARILEHPDGRNEGTSVTRNLGASTATGEYLAFLDADDVWERRKLSEQVAALENAPDVAMIFGLTRYWHSWPGSGSEQRDFVPDHGLKRPVNFSPPEFVTRFLRGRIVVPSASNMLLRRSAYLDCGGFEAAFPGMYEDQAFLVKLGLRSAVAGVPACWDRYRQHAASMTARAAHSEGESRRIFLEWIRDYCLANDLCPPAVFEALEKERWLLRTSRAARFGRFARTVRWLKKLSLRAEEHLVPRQVRQRIWLRRSGLSPAVRARRF